jgi:hypothetical protein
MTDAITFLIGKPERDDLGNLDVDGRKQNAFKRNVI